MKSVAIIQSNYIPWKGYFDIINSVDEFVLYDDMQYTKRDWRNRNKIVTKNGLLWLTIPVLVKGKFYQKIKDTYIVDNSWRKKHWNSLVLNYGKSKGFKLYGELFKSLYLDQEEMNLSEVNYSFIILICNILNIHTKISRSDNYEFEGVKTKPLVEICRACNADVYISGPSAKSYLDETLFEENGLQIEWMNYEGYREYKQINTQFNHYVSILDLIFNEGEHARNYMLSI